jgi:hypothetical protein
MATLDWGKIAQQKLHDVDEELFHTEEFLYLHIDLSTTEVVIQRDTLSTVPIFAGYQNDRWLCRQSIAGS